MPVSTSSSPPARGENLVDPSNTITTAKRQGRRERPQRATHTASVPPHDITAEESVLGAAMHTETALAILLDRTRAEDFYRPAHRTIHRAIRALHNQGQPVDPLTVKAALERDGALADIGGAPLLFDLYAVPPTVANAPAYAQTVVDHSLNRQLIDVGHQTIQAVYEGLGPAKTIRLVTDLLERVQASANGAAGTASGLDLDALLDLPLPEYDWLVEDLIERGDRIVLTGEEGAGKSTLIRQICVTLAAALHPFTFAPLPRPLRVLLVDFENSRLQTTRALRALRLQAGDRYRPGQLTVAVRPEGIDLSTPEGFAWLQAEVAAVPQLDLLAAGPVYKMATGNPSDEDVIRPIQQALDTLRTRYGFALILEAHSGHANSSGPRPTRPIGSSAWLRWPEAGLNVSRTGMLTHWRGQRDERTWPVALKRGGDWPWTHEEDAREQLWARILDHADHAPRKPSLRDLERALGVSRSTIGRVLQEHEEEWARLARDLWPHD
jgi:hypothetical protein